MKEVLLTLFYLLLFNFLIYRFEVFQFRTFKRFITHIIFNLKFLAGIFIWIVYTFYYQDVKNNDIHKFYQDALVLREVAKENPKAFFSLMLHDGDAQYTDDMKNWNRNFDEAPLNENRTIIRLNALLMFLSLKTYFVHILFFCFISLIGLILLCNSILSFGDKSTALIALPILLLPSLLFWTSGVMKEPLLVLGLGLCISSIVNGRWSMIDFLKLTCGLVIILLTKFFVLVCLLPALSAFLVLKQKGNPKLILLKYAVVSFLFLITAFNIQYIIPGVNPQQMLMNKQSHAIKEAAYFQAGSKVEIPVIEDNPLSIIKASVIGVWNVFTRPYVWEARNVMMLASAIENLLVLIWLLICIRFTNWRSIKHLNLFLYLVTFSLAYFALVGMATPVIGNLVRYKTPLLLLFMFAFAIISTPKTIPSLSKFVLRIE